MMRTRRFALRVSTTTDVAACVAALETELARRQIPHPPLTTLLGETAERIKRELISNGGQESTVISAPGLEITVTTDSPKAVNGWLARLLGRQVSFS